MELIIATRNPSKMLQIRPFFEGLPLIIQSMDEAGIEGEAVEDGDTLGENARKKAEYARDRSGKMSVADDTGLFIDALGGRPGIHAARWAGEGKTTEEIMRHTLSMLRDIPPEKRTAAFRTVAFLAMPDGSHREFFGEVRGTILLEPKAPPQPKMPYSGIFLADGYDKVWAEMSVEEENAMSHRGKAFRLVREFLLG